ncbi:hypothetical protein A2U01_0112852, partial [Trifolium medium]|nr:hypothetical protein [Trifolium medium]
MQCFLWRKWCDGSDLE